MISYTLLINVAPKSTSYHHKYLKTKRLQPLHVGNNKKGPLVPTGCYKTSGHTFVGCIGLAKYIILKPEAENYFSALQRSKPYAGTYRVLNEGLHLIRRVEVK